MVKTVYGLMEGIDHGTYTEYRRVPYAKPPVGELRLRRPVKPEPWEGIYQAKEYAPCCMQDENRAGEPWAKDFYADPAFLRPSSEDCLYLNIWAPKDTDPAEKYPVAFWIHGGAFLGGFATELEFDGAEYAKRGVILVSVEYRCNLFGYMAHPWLSAEDEEGISGNYGSYDQLAALDWVIENIPAFGGDASNITVFGQSAGAMSTQTLVSSPLSRGKIAKAIFQSGGSYGIGFHNDMPMKTAEHYGELLTDMLGIGSLEELRRIPEKELMADCMAWMGKLMQTGEAKGLFLTPNMDNKLLTQGYYETVDNNSLLDIPYMVGWTADDMDVQGPDRAYKDADAPETMLKAGSLALAERLRDLGRPGAYVYAFNRKLPGDGWGAYHSSELFYVFGTLSRTWRPFTEGDYALSSRMIDYWTNFMKTGDPNAQGLPQWNAYRKEAPFIMELDVE